MNHRMIQYMLLWIMRLEGMLFALPVIIAIIYKEVHEGIIYLIFAAVLFTFGTLFVRKKPANSEIFQREGMVTVALGWLLFCVIGALPFVVCGEIPFYIDALFETVSGCTTTGASILPEVEALSHASLFWRSFTHWIGGMGVLVFLLIVLPVRDGSQINVMKAESPGPEVSKFVPRLRNTAIMLYKIYIVMTVIQIVVLLITGMNWFDSFCITFGTAGTGGFTVLNTGMASYTPLQHWIIAVFMILFGVNFSFYYLIIIRKGRDAIKMEEVRVYIIIILLVTAVVGVNIRNMYATTEEVMRHSFFQVSSIITTTGFATADFNLWPALSKVLILLIMFIGACAGSTGGGIKVSRIIVLGKAVRREFYTLVHPRSIKKVKVNGQAVSDGLVRTILTFLCAYVLLFVFSLILVSLDGGTFETNFSAVAATINNVGPGLGDVGPVSNFAAYSPLSKIVLTFDMLAGRLELYPMMLLFIPGTWKRKS